MTKNQSNQFKFYAFVPGDLVSGGPEALHQLAEKGRALGFDVSVVYCHPEQQTEKSRIAYDHYDVTVADHAQDEHNSVLIVPEVHTGVLRSFRKARKAVWWLSVDNYFRSRSSLPLKKRLLRKDAYSLRSMRRFVHAAQSEYARTFLVKRGFKSIFMLSDYLGDQFATPDEKISLTPRKDVVLFNPAKDDGFVMRLVEHNPDIEWRALEKMTPQEVANALKQSKLYIDFGSHPGKDRIPREAVQMGCNIVVGNRGSASNRLDMPIPEKYKIKQFSGESIDSASSLIRDMLKNYWEHLTAFDEYRDQIRIQESVFESEVNTFFSSLSEN